MKKSYINNKVELRDSKIGKGVFAKEKILKDEVITDFSTGPGKLIKSEEADKLFKGENDHMIQTDDDLFFAATEDKEFEDTDYINHSCDPNCGVRDSLKIVAMKDIEKDEEITFDYAMSESSEYSIKCECGAINCRGKVTGDDWKIKELQEKYKGYFSDYLQNKIDKIHNL